MIMYVKIVKSSKQIGIASCKNIGFIDFKLKQIITDKS